MVLKLSISLCGNNKDSKCLRANAGIRYGPTTEEQQDGKSYMVCCFKICTIHLILLHDQIKEVEMRGACRLHTGNEKHVKNLI
jgi:hypothetical protein